MIHLMTLEINQYNVQGRLISSNFGCLGVQRYFFENILCILQTHKRGLRKNIDIIEFLIKGSKGVQRHVDTLLEKAKYFTNRIKGRPEEFQLVLEKPQLTNVCFYYVPPSLRNEDKNSQNYKNRISKVIILIYVDLQELTTSR